MSVFEPLTLSQAPYRKLVGATSRPADRVAEGTGTSSTADAGGTAAAIEFEQRGDCAILRVKGEVAWTIDASRYSGRPSLHAKRDGDGYRVELAGAVFVGTDIPADFSCHLLMHGGAWLLRLRLAVAARDCEVLLDDWLTGKSPAKTEGSLPAASVGGAHLLATKHTTVVFTPDNCLSLRAPDLASLRTLGLSASCAHVELLPLGADHPSLLKHKPQHRTLITFHGVHAYDKAPIAMPAGSALIAVPDLLHVVSVEASDEDPGVWPIAIWGSALDATATCRLELGGGTRNLRGEPFAVTLGEAVHAFVRSPREDLVLGTPVDTAGEWLVNGRRAAIRVVPSGDPIELSARDATEAHLTCPLRILEAAIRTPSMLISPLTFATPPLLSIDYDGRTPLPPGAVSLLLRHGQRALLGPIPDPSFELYRPDDFLALRFHLYNFDLNDAADQIFQRRDANAVAHVVVEFAPQSISEETFPEDGDTTGLKPTRLPVAAALQRPSQAELAENSRLCFRMPNDLTGLDCTEEALLRWDHFTLVPPAATGVRPGVLETDIECPYRLSLTPRGGTWAHSIAPRTIKGWAELWRTQLLGAPGSPPRIAPVWSPDYPNPGPAPAGMRALRPVDRNAIVDKARDAPFDIDGLSLSAMGAWLKLNVAWPANRLANRNDLAEWQHTMSAARDHLVRIAYHGFLLPFGHPAALTRVTERKFRNSPDPSNAMGAYPCTRCFIAVGKADILVHDWRIPFTRVRIETLTTPNLQGPCDPQQPQWPVPSLPPGGTIPFSFKLTAWDCEQHEITFEMPLLWVPLSMAGAPAVQAKYRGDAATYRTPSLASQSVAFAQSANRGATSLYARYVEFDVDTPLLGAPPDPAGNASGFAPTAKRALVQLPALKHWLGGAPAPSVAAPRTAAGRAPTSDRGWIALTDPANNPAGDLFGMFARSVPGSDPADPTSAAVGLALDMASYGADKCGGLALPSFDIQSLTRNHGPMAIDPTSLGANVNLGDLLAPDATLFGVIPLRTLLNIVVPTIDLPAKMPKVVTTYKDGTAVAIVVDYTLPAIDVQPVPPLLLRRGDVPQPPPQISLSITVHVEAAVSTQAAQASRSISGQLQNFQLSLGVLGIDFRSLSFNSDHGKTVDVQADVAGAEFKGPLAFLAPIANYLNFGKPGGTGPSLSVTLNGVEAGLGINLPDIGIGVFSLQGLAVSARLQLPFTALLTGHFVPQLRFAISSRDKPFLLTVAIFGGGGYFAIEFGYLNGGLCVTSVEVALEFGGAAAIDVVVASGSIYILAGIYFRLDGATNSALVAGFVRCGGAFDVFGMVTISVEFSLTLTWSHQNGQNTVYGTALVTIEIDVMFFSASVQFSVTRTFAGASGGSTRVLADDRPSFGEIMTRQDWKRYWSSFGMEAA